MILSFIDLKAEDIELKPLTQDLNTCADEKIQDSVIARADTPETGEVTDEVHRSSDRSSGPRDLFELKYLSIREKVEKARFERELLARSV